MFYKSSQRSTVLDRRASAHAAMSDHDNWVEEEGFAYDDDHEGDYVLEEIARAARAEADSATGSPSVAARDRLSPFESELLSAWSEK